MIAIANDVEDPYPSLSDYHDYEPNLEFDDTELQTTSNNGKIQKQIINYKLYKTIHYFHHYCFIYEHYEFKSITCIAIIFIVFMYKSLF